MESQKDENVKKPAAVLVVDLPGMTGLSADNFPEGVTGLLTRFADTFDGVVSLYGGTMERESGERMIAFFGLEDKRDSYSSQAVQAALELRNRVEMMVSGQELPEGTGLRAGLAAGEVIAGVTGSGKNRRYTVIGSPVELAARLHDLAETGQILAGPEIFRQTGGQFDYRTLEPMHLKGQKKPVSVYELGGRKKEAKNVSAESMRMISSIMVGRTKEASSVEELVKQLLNGRGGVLNIEGAAGIGKSRLIAEVRNREIMGNIAFFEGRALSEGKNLSFHPLIQVIKSWAGIRDEDNTTVAFQKLSGNIQRIFPEQAQEIIPFISTMMGYPLEGEARQRLKGIEGEALEKLILKNTRDLLARAAALRPVVIMVEDAHWADISSITFMESLFKLARSHRLLFINVFRPGHKDTGERLKAFVKENLPDHGREIILKPLQVEESVDMISNLLNRTGLPEDIRELIVRRSAGNPFFIEEVIRSFIDEGLIEMKDNEFIITERIQYANIPETIDKVILSRIERLDEKTKSLLKTASVIGRNFYYKVLEEAAQAIEELDSRLEYLKETQLLGESRHKEEVEFLFKHALAQQATYDSILQKTKKELHLKIARSIEKVFADKIHEFYGILAMHYGKADVTGKKLEYLVKAGDEAFSSGASNEAMNFYMEALQLLQKSPENQSQKDLYKELEIKVGFAQEAAGNNIEAVETFHRVIFTYFGHRFPSGELQNKYQGISRMLVVMFKMNFQVFYFRKKPDEDFNTFMRVITQWGEALSTMNPRRFFMQSMYLLSKMINYDLSGSLYGLSVFTECANLFMWTGISFSVSKKILDYAKRAGVEDHPSSLIDYRYTRKMHDFHTGNMEEDLYFGDVYQAGIRIGDFWPTTIYTLYSGIVTVELGKYEKFLEFVGKLEEISESFDNSHAKAEIYRLSAMGHYRFRKLDRALELADEGIRYTGKTGHFAMLLVIWCAKALVHAEKKEMDAAKGALQEAEKLVKDRKIITIYYFPFAQAKAQIELQEFRTAISRNEKTGEPARKLLKTVGLMIRLSKKMRSGATEAYRLKAITCWMLGKQRQALRNFTLSIKAGQNYHCTLELSRTYFEAGKCLQDVKSARGSLLGITGSEYLLMAGRMFEEMDLQWDLQEYERYMEG